MDSVIKLYEIVCERPCCGRKFLTERGAKRHYIYSCKSNPKSINHNRDKYKHLLGIPLFE